MTSRGLSFAQKRGQVWAHVPMVTEFQGETVYNKQATWEIFKIWKFIDMHLWEIWQRCRPCQLAIFINRFQSNTKFIGNWVINWKDLKKFILNRLGFGPSTSRFRGIGTQTIRHFGQYFSSGTSCCRYTLYRLISFFCSSLSLLF